MIFQKANILLKDILPLIRLAGYSHNDEAGRNIILCLECEDWTHVQFNANSGLLDLLGDLVVESIDADGDDIQLWIVTDNFNEINGVV